MLKHPLQIALELEGISQRDLSRRVSLTEETISLAVHGKRKLSEEAKERIALIVARPAKELFPEEAEDA